MGLRKVLLWINRRVSWEPLGDIVQVGIVVDDMDKVKRGMKTIFGLDPSAESDNVYKKTWYKGDLIDAQ